MRILVTGANGYLGQGIVKRLLDDGVNVVATDFSVQNVDKRAVALCCDLFSVENPFDYFKKPDVVLHLAWRDGFVHNSLSHINDLPKHFKFLNKMIQNEVSRIAITGSMHEIGFFEGSIDETTPTNPLSLYGVSKNALRQAIQLQCEQNHKTFQWLRGYYIVGNTEYGSSIFSKITQSEKQEKKLFPFTTGKNQWDFIDYDEFCMQVAATVEQETINGIINICSGHPEKLSDRVERFIKENGYKIKLDYGKYPDRPYDSKAVWGNEKKIQAILQYREAQK